MARRRQRYYLPGEEPGRYDTLRFLSGFALILGIFAIGRTPAQRYIAQVQEAPVRNAAQRQVEERAAWLEEHGITYGASLDERIGELFEEFAVDCYMRKGDGCGDVAKIRNAAFSTAQLPSQERWLCRGTASGSPAVEWTYSGSFLTPTE